jgi:hypothetical protein
MSHQNAKLLFGIALSIPVLTQDGFAQDLHPGAPEPNARPTLGSIREIAEALRGCWVPPPLDQAFQGMTVTVRFTLKGNGEIIAEPRVAYATEGAPSGDIYSNSVVAAFARCGPLPLDAELRRTIVGRPIWVRFVDGRKIAKQAFLAN